MDNAKLLYTSFTMNQTDFSAIHTPSDIPQLCEGFTGIEHLRTTSGNLRELHLRRDSNLQQGK
jgi:hypothetical protein